MVQPAIARLALLVMVIVLVPSGADAAAPLFAEPMHLTREVADPISGSTSKIDEYCFGNRVVSLRGTEPSIADDEKGELTEIDRTKGTYSVTSFDAIARALPEASSGAAKKIENQRAPELTDLGVRPVGARGGRAFESRIESPGASRKVEVVVDEQLKLSREGIEVLIGAAFPLRRSPEHDITIAASGRDRASGKVGPGFARDHALPLEQTVTWEIDGDTLRVENRIVRVGNELPPPDLIAIPPGATLVESDLVLRKKMLEELDRLPSANPAARP